MAKTENTVASLVKRGSPSAWPHELEVVDDPSDPFFDDRNEGTPLETLIADRCSAGMKLQFTLYRGDEKEAAGASMSENEQRDEDPLINKIKRAQRLAKHGHTAADIADYCGVSEQTAKKWLGRDLSAPPAKPKTRGKPTRPSAAKIRAAGALAVEHAADEIRTVLDWVNGTNGVDDAEFYRVFPALAPKAKGKKAA